MDFLVRFSQMHETFRVPELLALAELEGVPATVTSYSPAVPFCLVRAPSAAAAARLVRRAILVQAVYEHWGSGPTLEALHAAVRQTSSHLWEAHAHESWKFRVDSFQGARGAADRADLINSFRYLPLRGPIRMRDPEQEYVVFEEWPFDPHRRGAHQQAEDKGEENGEVDGDDGDNTEEGGKSGGRKSSKKTEPTRYHFGRFLGRGARDLVGRYDLKKRPYISTTSMDSELALVTANLALAAPGKLFYDPFVGTGSFPLACAAFGATSWGSDIDGRAVRGTGHDARAAGQRGAVRGEKTLRGNFRFYGVEHMLGDAFTSDLTNTPLRRAPFGAGGAGGRRRLFDGIVCDPPYGVREGLRVLGCRDPEGTPWVVEAGLTKYKCVFHCPPPPKHSHFSSLLVLSFLPSPTRYLTPRLETHPSSPPRSHTVSPSSCKTSCTSPPRRSSTAAGVPSGCPPPTTRSRNSPCRRTPVSSSSSSASSPSTAGHAGSSHTASIPTGT